MLLLDFLNFIIAIVLIFLTIIIFHPTNKFKLVKSKEEQLFLQKTLLTTIFNVLIILRYVLFITGSDEQKPKLFFLELIIFNMYIIAIVLYNFFFAFELYFTFSNPVHYFNRLFKQKRYNYLPEYIIILASIITLAIDFLLYKGDYEDTEDTFKCDDYTIFIIIVKWKSFVILILSILSLAFFYNII